ncbi:hypothetical protein GCM10017668_05700 [Streptomyces tuirus]|uniref:Uncharacterized protein n=1 Tax=Streptomyces tuirus TaxID=68278 RepID=A0A7G1NAE8_9ACTN|nr:hypothetical protein GCM10017668_05700 [Streptomyces tuirus]
MAAGDRFDRPGLLQQLEGGLHGAVAHAEPLRKVAHPGQAGVFLLAQQQNRELPGSQSVAGQKPFVGSVHGADSKQDSGY